MNKARLVKQADIKPRPTKRQRRAAAALKPQTVATTLQTAMRWVEAYRNTDKPTPRGQFRALFATPGGTQ